MRSGRAAVAKGHGCLLDETLSYKKRLASHPKYIFGLQFRGHAQSGSKSLEIGVPALGRFLAGGCFHAEEPSVDSN
jgi:hypothetical protein